MKQLELNVVESFRLAKSDIIEIQNVVTQLSQKQEELMEMIDNLRVKETKLYHNLKILKEKKPVTRTVKKVKKIVVNGRKAHKIFIAAKNGKSVHEKNCPFAKNIKPKSKVIFKTKSKAFNLGYKACDCIKRV